MRCPAKQIVPAFKIAISHILPATVALIVDFDKEIVGSNQRA